MVITIHDLPMETMDNPEDSKPKLRGHTNEEDMRECPYCGKEALSRGLYVHVYNSDDDKHGPRDSVPEGFDPKDAPIVGKRKVTILNPTEYNVDHKRYICKYCQDTFRGELGLKIHLGRSGGDDDPHPSDVDPKDIESFPAYPSTNNDEIIVDNEEEAEKLKNVNASILINDSDESIDKFLPSEAGGESQTDTIPLSELKNLRNDFLKNDEEDRPATWFHAADRVKSLINKYEDN